VKSFLFVGHLISFFLSWVGQFTYLRSQKTFIHFSYIAYNLKATNSSVHKHVHCFKKPKNFMPIKLIDFTELPKVTIPSCSLQFNTIRSSESVRLVPRWPHISADEPIPIHVPITPQRLAGAGPRSHRLPACTTLRDQPEAPERQPGWQWEQTGGSRPQTEGGAGNTGGIVSETLSWCHAVAMTLSCVHRQT